VMMGGMLIGFFIVYFRFGFGFFMRNFERQADIYLYRFYPDATPLIRTFHKIAAISRQSMDRPNWHHFSIGQRIRFLELCQANPALVNQHHRRVRRMVIGAVIGLLAVFWLGYSINYGRLKPGFDTYIARQVVFQQLENNPENVDLQVLAADFHYSRQDYTKARDMYEAILRTDKDHVHALNNLAWLLTTCPDESMRDHEKALALAGRAAGLSRAPFVLDTYAEALFANNRVEEALQAAQEALALAEDRHAYYREQVKRFEAHLYHACCLVNGFGDHAAASGCHHACQGILHRNQFSKKAFITQVPDRPFALVGFQEQLAIPVSAVRQTPDKNFNIPGTVVKSLGIQKISDILLAFTRIGFMDHGVKTQNNGMNPVSGIIRVKPLQKDISPQVFFRQIRKRQRRAVEYLCDPGIYGGPRGF
jgi:tetratricopeptide (TPR) repeat protein